LATKCCALIIIASRRSLAPARYFHWVYCALYSSSSCW